MKPIRTAFIGTSVEGVSSLEMLHHHPQFEIVAVVTQPDKPVGRKQELQPTPIKQAALKLNLPVVESVDPEKSFAQVVNDNHPELAIVIAFGQFLPAKFLSSLSHHCLNVHYSLLPILRGAVPVQMAILQGHQKTGVTVQIMEETMDTGPMLIQDTLAIAPRETTPSLKEKLIPLGEKLLRDILPTWVAGSVTPETQDNANATYCYMKDISKENAEINWLAMSPEHIDRMVRALLPWPVAWTILGTGQRLKIFEAEIVSLNHYDKPGAIIENNKELVFSTQVPDKAIRVISGQIEGKTRMPGTELARGLRPTEKRPPH